MNVQVRPLMKICKSKLTEFLKFVHNEVPFQQLSYSLHEPERRQDPGKFHMQRPATDHDPPENQESQSSNTDTDHPKHNIQDPSQLVVHYLHSVSPWVS